VKHLRDEEDIKADRSRNINLLEKMAKQNKIDGRMQFYYGKELYEIGRPHEAITTFEKALEQKLETHDHVLSLQYGAYASIACYEMTKPEYEGERTKYFSKAMDFAHKGIQLDPNRAEFYVVIGDAYIRAQKLPFAVPYFAAAKACLKNFNSPYEGAVYSFKNLYGEAPSLQLSKIYLHLGMLDRAKKEATNCLIEYKNEEAKALLAQIEKITSLVNTKNNQTETEDIVFTTPPQNAYPFDEEIYKTKPLGGSETALVQMAKLLREKTGRRVIVFNQREEALIADSGVEYWPNAKTIEYFSQNRPYKHIMWRHNIKLTEAESYLWGHDLITPTVEGGANFDKFLCLSPFHKDYTMGIHGVPESKIIVTRNGIDPKKFNFIKKEKNPNKLVWMSSPDRGLERCMLICDKVKEKYPKIELHVYYGIENLYKYGPQMSALADKLKGMMSERPYVKYHGFTEQSQMYKEVSDAVIWPHCNNFIETFCITALETLANQIFPVVRKLGALADTLKEAETKGQAVLLEYDWDDVDNGIKLHADAVCEALENERWKGVNLNLEKHSWSNVANEWIEFMHIEPKRKVETA
jgi:glycosyltransferase involved in cell wall biosynthesis